MSSAVAHEGQAQPVPIVRNAAYAIAYLHMRHKASLALRHFRQISDVVRIQPNENDSGQAVPVPTAALADQRLLSFLIAKDAYQRPVPALGATLWDPAPELLETSAHRRSHCGPRSSRLMRITRIPVNSRPQRSQELEGAGSSSVRSTMGGRLRQAGQPTGTLAVISPIRRVRAVRVIVVAAT
jgi:hypothetical protein